MREAEEEREEMTTAERMIRNANQRQLILDAMKRLGKPVSSTEIRPHVEGVPSGRVPMALRSLRVRGQIRIVKGQRRLYKQEPLKYEICPT
jgi:hypothetical protein